ncbi:hypothetical protein RA280_23300 [Cupriavidus sp. CV2]|uniref:hypothetical protein n=1 Tax=Cupriavidus ulmosensis TaxID=3065913 RepID=UPI00296ACED9|nr:hypothetical protein [Cupriavidus sp. CV2]MDW3684618.1 hypothetical protein [Cupriavidus sp. CV2]
MAHTLTTVMESVMKSVVPPVMEAPEENGTKHWKPAIVISRIIWVSIIGVFVVRVSIIRVIIIGVPMIRIGIAGSPGIVFGGVGIVVVGRSWNFAAS